MIKRLLAIFLVLCLSAYGAPLSLGDIAEDATVAFEWSTVDSTGKSVTRASNGTIKVRRHGDGTDCTGTAVTDTEDTPDTGLHECIVDTSNNVNFTTGNDYTVWLDGAVIDGITVNAVLAHFSIENRYDGVGTGTGLIAVDEDTGGVDNLAYKTVGGAGIGGAVVRAYVASEFVTNNVDADIRGQTTTDDDGGWIANLMLNSGVEYTIWFYKQGEYGPDTENVTP